MQRVLRVLKETKCAEEDPTLVGPFLERQRLVGQPEWDAQEKRYICVMSNPPSCCAAGP